jgi:hypothetical protein
MGSIGLTGTMGPIGLTGPMGPIRPDSPDNSYSDIIEFFALIPNDNTSSVAVGGYVEFPQNGPSSASVSTNRTSSSNFILKKKGLYLVFFQASVAEPGQLVLEIGGVPIMRTVVGRDTGTTQIIGHSLVRTTINNTSLRVQNPSGNSTALTLSSIAGGASPVSANLRVSFLEK